MVQVQLDVRRAVAGAGATRTLRRAAPMIPRGKVALPHGEQNARGGHVAGDIRHEA